MLATPAFQASSNKSAGAFLTPHIKWAIVAISVGRGMHIFVR